MMKDEIVTARNYRGESEDASVERVQEDWPDKTVVFEDPDTLPLAAEDRQADVGPRWLEAYARPLRQGDLSYESESPATRGNKLLAELWQDLLPDLKKRGVYKAPDEVPKDVAKWAVLPDWVALLIKFPHVQRNVFDWMDQWVPRSGHDFRSGASKLHRERKDLSVARSKQYGQGFNDPTPSFTFHGERLPYQRTKKLFLDWILRNKTSYPDLDFHNLDVQSMDNWDQVMGGRCSTYVFAETTALYHGMTPQQETDSPIPWDIFAAAWKRSMNSNFPGYGPGESTLNPAALFVGTSTSGGITIGNSDGSAGYPYTNMELDDIRTALRRPKFKGRTTKGVAFPHALNVVVKWIQAGMPMEGPEYRAMAQPATLSFRGDRAVHLGVRALASRAQDQEGHATSNRLAATLPGRSIIIVPTCLILAESLWAQPLGNFIAGSGTPGFDWVDPGHTVKRLNDIRQLDLQQGAKKGSVFTVGADASGWDRDVVGQFIAGETAWYMSMFPEYADVLYVDAALPIDVDETWVANTTAELQAGGQESYQVVGILPDGSERTIPAVAEVVRFNLWEYISKVMTMINDGPIHWADYVTDAPGIAYDIGRVSPEFAGFTVVSNGGRRTGDAATGIGNSWTNDVVTEAAAEMSRAPELADLRTRRAALQGSEAGPPYEVLDKLSRGDDLALAIKLPKGGNPSKAIASGIQSVGMRAHPDKQEASDISGHPVFGFANVLVTANYMGKLAGRTVQRYMVQESRGLNLEMLNAIREIGNETGLSDAILATTATAKARLAPMAGFPLMDEHPLTPNLVEWAVHNDEMRLSYVTEHSFDEFGHVTEEARELIAKAADVEARAQAKLRARRENVSVDLEALKEAYAGSTIHDHVLEYALVDNYEPTRKMERVDNHAIFKEAVRVDEALPLLE